jgi:hypothetical protein
MLRHSSRNLPLKLSLVGVLPRLAWGDEGALDARAAQPAEHISPDLIGSGRRVRPRPARREAPSAPFLGDLRPRRLPQSMRSPPAHRHAVTAEQGCAHAGSPSADTAPSTRACVRPQARLWRPASIRSETTSERRSEARMRADMKRPAPGRTPPARGVSTRSPPVSIWRHGFEQGVTASEQRTGWRQNSGPDDAWAVG